ncbi:MAG: ankyrin repeat domain-containing protein [Candidatus Dependentiae bacterium]|nr:ankyrin repeat domain-containing protein [Candidatus Dependentiae bacterium]
MKTVHKLAMATLLVLGTAAQLDASNLPATLRSWYMAASHTLSDCLNRLPYYNTARILVNEGIHKMLPIAAIPGNLVIGAEKKCRKVINALYPEIQDTGWGANILPAAGPWSSDNSKVADKKVAPPKQPEGEKKTNTNTRKQNNIGWEKLHSAVIRGNIEQAKALLEEGININATNKRGETVLHIAVHGSSGLGTLSRLDVVRFLLENNADVNAKDYVGWTPLHEALAWDMNLDIIKALVNKGARIFVAEKRGYTPLHFACAHAGVETVKFLLAMGASVDSKNKLGETALDVALRRQRGDILDLLDFAGQAAQIAEKIVKKNKE